jgi:predicted  nucleic acid-binding Zn-ribbon protein
MAMIQRTCSTCGQKFDAREADVRRGWAKCCSKSCAAKRREKRLNSKFPNRRRPWMDADDSEEDDVHPFSEEAVQPVVSFC